MIVHLIGTNKAFEKYRTLEDEIWKSARDVEEYALNPCLYDEDKGWWSRLNTKAVLREMRKGMTDHDIMIVLDDGNSPVIPHWVLAYLSAGVYRLAVPRRFKPSDGSDCRDGIAYYGKFETLADLFELYNGTTWALNTTGTSVNYL